MIHLYFAPEHDKDIHIEFSGRWFTDILNLCKMNMLSYHAELKHFLIAPKKFLDIDFYNQLKDMDDIDFVVGDLDLIKEHSTIKLEAQKRRFKVNQDLIKVTPLKGKTKENENYQYEGLVEGLQWNRRYFAWAPGTGKSWLMLNQIDQLFGADLIDKALVVCKAEGVVTTKKKILEFSNSFKEEELLVVNTSKERRYFLTDPKYKNIKIALITYTTWRAIVDEEAKNQKKRFSSRTRKYLFDFNKIGWGTKRGLFLDESQELGNHSSKQTKSIDIHKQFFDKRFCYSGSPADESPLKWYSQLKILDTNMVPGTFSEWFPNIAKVGKMIGKRYNPFMPGDIIPEKYQVFKDTILSKYVNFKSKDVLDLPEKTEEDIYVELSNPHRKIVNEIVQATLIKIKEDNGGLLSSEKFRKNMMAIHSVLDNPSIFHNEEKEEKYSYKDNLKKELKNWDISKHSKIEAVNSLVKKHIDRGEKVVIFSWHPETIDELSEYFKKLNPLKIHGKMKPRKGQSKDDLKFEVANKFQNDPKVKLGIFSSLSFKTSIDLNKAHAVIYFDFTGSYMEYDQSSSRIFRNGLLHPITIYRLVIENSLNERNLKLINNKELEKDSLFNQKTYFTKEDYISILKGEII